MENESHSKKPKRRSYKNRIVDKGLQRRLSFYFMGINFCVSGAALIVLINYVRRVQLALADVPELNPQSNDELVKGLIGLISTSVILVVVTIAVNFMCGLYLAHRFAGPMKVITDYIDELIAGSFGSKRELRPNDELMPIMEKLKTLSSKLKENQK